MTAPDMAGRSLEAGDRKHLQRAAEKVARGLSSREGKLTIAIVGCAWDANDTTLRARLALYLGDASWPQPAMRGQIDVEIPNASDKSTSWANEIDHAVCFAAFRTLLSLYRRQ